MKTLAVEAHRKGLDLVYEVAPEVADALLGDSVRLRQILFNLIGNGIKFTERGKVAVRVQSRACADSEVTCHFTVSDTGIGIAREKQRAIFAPFLQADTSTTRVYGGTGLGLTISAHLVEMMNGKIWVESEPGKGSTFHFTVRFGLQGGTTHERTDADSAAAPRSAFVVPAPDGARIAPLSPETARTNKRALAILLVEDNPVNRRLAQHVLEKEGHHVVAVDNGAAALGAIETWHFDLVLMDVQMPRMDGVETTVAIRSREKVTGERVPVIALTAHAMARDRERCMKAGLDGYLIKPIQPAMLLDAVERVQLVSAERSNSAEAKVTLDRDALMDRVGGDLQLLDEITGMFLQNCGKLIASAREAMAGRDASQFTHDVHTLRGMLGNLSAIAAQELAGELEELSLLDEHEKAEATFALLEREVYALKAELSRLTREAMVPSQAT
jgi:CheY-like chemotaxis protein/HPt (histidine-containing phosphotransfer) domain-containing protein